MPIKGAVTTAAVMNLPWAPTTGKRVHVEKITYRAAKHAVNAMFLDDNCDFEKT